MATNGGDVLASELMTALLTGEDVSIPTIDPSGSEYSIPGDINSNAYDVLVKLSDSDLTTGAINGTGAFDKLMVGVAAQLQREYDAGRITGAEYTKAYIALTGSALSSSLQYLLSRDAAYWQAVQAQAASVTARVQLATAKIQNAAAKLEAMNVKANYALTKLKLSVTDAEYGTATYNLENLLPAQLAMTNAQKLGQDKQNETANYTLINLLPKQVDLLGEQIAGAVKDTETKTYTLDELMPVQKLNLQEQAEAQRGQTMDTRSDGTTPIAGSIGKQNSLYAQQVVSYQKDSQLKAAKVITDTWITCRSIAEDFPLPKQFDYLSTDYATEKVFQTIIDDNDLG